MNTNDPLVDVSATQLCQLKGFSFQQTRTGEAVTYELNMADLSVMLKLADVGVISTDDPAYVMVQHGVGYGKVYDGIVHKGKHAVALTEVGNIALVDLFGSKEIRSYRAMLNPVGVPASTLR